MTPDRTQKVGLSEAPCSRRIRRLENDEVILGYHARLDPEAVGIGFVAFVTLEGFDQRMCEAVQSIAVGEDGFTFYLVQHLAHLLRRIFVMIQERNKVGDGSLKVDIVFPQRIVGIDQQGLLAI